MSTSAWRCGYFLILGYLFSDDYATTMTTGFFHRFWVGKIVSSDGVLDSDIGAQHIRHLGFGASAFGKSSSTASVGVLRDNMLRS